MAINWYLDIEGGIWAPQTVGAAPLCHGTPGLIVRIAMVCPSHLMAGAVAPKWVVPLGGIGGLRHSGDCVSGTLGVSSTAQYPRARNPVARTQSHWRFLGSLSGGVEPLSSACKPGAPLDNPGILCSLQGRFQGDGVVPQQIEQNWLCM